MTDLLTSLKSNWELAQGGALESFGALVYLIVLIGTLYYRWYVAVSALETGWAVGWVLVLADFVISVSITRLIL